MGYGRKNGNGGTHRKTGTDKNPGAISPKKGTTKAPKGSANG